jgi:hypothetical protein
VPFADVCPRCKREFDEPLWTVQLTVRALELEWPDPMADGSRNATCSVPSTPTAVAGRHDQVSWRAQARRMPDHDKPAHGSFERQPQLTSYGYLLGHDDAPEVRVEPQALDAQLLTTHLVLAAERGLSAGCRWNVLVDAEKVAWVVLRLHCLEPPIVRPIR